MTTSTELLEPLRVAHDRGALTALDAPGAIRAAYRRTFSVPGTAATGDDGRLWTRLAHRRRVGIVAGWDALASTETVRVMWDADPIGPPPPAEREFGCDAVLECTAGDLELVIEQLPATLYVFDDSLTWSIVFTRSCAGEGSAVLLASPVGSAVA